MTDKHSLVHALIMPVEWGLWRWFLLTRDGEVQLVLPSDTKDKGMF